MDTTRHPGLLSVKGPLYLWLNTQLNHSFKFSSLGVSRGRCVGSSSEEGGLYRVSVTIDEPPVEERVSALLSLLRSIS